MAALEYRFTNPTASTIEAVYPSTPNFMAIRKRPEAPEPGKNAILATEGGFVLWQSGMDERPWEQGAFSASAGGPDVGVDIAWFRGGGFDALSVLWKTIGAGGVPANVVRRHTWGKSPAPAEPVRPLPPGPR